MINRKLLKKRLHFDFVLIFIFKTWIYPLVIFAFLLCIIPKNDFVEVPPIASLLFFILGFFLMYFQGIKRFYLVTLYVLGIIYFYRGSYYAFFDLTILGFILIFCSRIVSAFWKKYAKLHDIFEKNMRFAFWILLTFLFFIFSMNNINNEIHIVSDKVFYKCTDTIYLSASIRSYSWTSEIKKLTNYGYEPNDTIEIRQNMIPFKKKGIVYKFPAKDIKTCVWIEIDNSDIIPLPLFSPYGYFINYGRKKRADFISVPFVPSNKKRVLLNIE
ncbi:hypothetical protein AALK14_18965 [Butyricimonas hominis]|uniref:hypothetical protein n=1 Tax=Butyricimonas TaxID=574697 RepID=UPI003511728C